jgi:hypothetical protein
LLYTIYKTTNLINNKIYIGKHQTSDLNDGYLGSGKLLQRAIAKLGRDKFTKEILFVFDNIDDMNRKEREIVTEEFCLRRENYNISVGGHGGFNHINRNKQFFVEKSNKTVSEWSPEYAAQVREKKSRPGDKNGMYGSSRTGKQNPRYGAIVTQETKDKISLAHMGKVSSNETRQKLSLSQKARWTAERKALRSQQQKQLGTIPPSLKGMLWWSDGTTSVRAKECPGEGFIRGRIGWKNPKV